MLVFQIFIFSNCRLRLAKKGLLQLTVYVYLNGGIQCQDIGQSVVDGRMLSKSCVS